MKNTNIAKVMKVISKLVAQPVEEMLKEGFLQNLDTMPITTFRCQFQTRLNGRKWLAPLYRPVLGSFTIKPGTFVAVRFNQRSCDVEFWDSSSKEHVVYTVTRQHWNEKEGYFQSFHQGRIRGGLGQVVEEITQLRRSALYAETQKAGRNESSTGSRADGNSRGSARRSSSRR